MYLPFLDDPEIGTTPELDELEPLATTPSFNRSGFEEKLDVTHPDGVPSQSHQSHEEPSEDALESSSGAPSEASEETPSEAPPDEALELEQLEQLEQSGVDVMEAAAEQTSLPATTPFNFLRLTDIVESPQPKWLIDRFLPAGGTSLVTGPHASYKSFLTLDIGFCVATGLPWHGFAVKQGLVVYIAAEGVKGLGNRAQALLEHYGQQRPDNFLVLGAPVQFSDQKTRASFVAKVAALKPVLIIIDTLARCTVNVDENSSRSMGALVDAIYTIVENTGAHVMIVHHNNKGGEYRGSSALPAAVDSHFAVERDWDGDQVTLTTKKQKDAEEHPVLTFEKKIVEIHQISQTSCHNMSVPESVPTSLVFEMVESSGDGNGSGNISGKLHGFKKQVFQKLVDDFGDEGATTGQWSNVCEAAGIDGHNYNRTRRELVDMGAVVVQDSHGQPVDKAALGAMSTKAKTEVMYFPKF